MTSFRWFINSLRVPSAAYTPTLLAMYMAGPKPVEKVTKGLNSLIDEFSSAVKELVNAGEETVVHLAVGGGRAISAIVDATGEVTKVTVETAGNVVGTIGGSAVRIAKGQTGEEKAEEENE